MAGISPKRKGADGRWLCRVCGHPCPPRRTSFCSEDCSDDVNWPFVRHKVWQRDRGVCAVCGLDTMRLDRILGHAFEWYERQEKGEVLRELGLPLGRSMWEADHILPRCRGGKNRLGNLRTLCVACHKIETVHLARERADERRAAANLARQPLFDGVPA